MAEYNEQQNNDIISTIPPDTALEQLLDKIADALIVSPLIDTTDVENAQKTISRGKIQVGRDSTTDRLILYQKDVKANQEDLQQTTELDSGETISTLQNIANQIIDFDTLDVGITEGIDNSVGISLIGGNLPDGGMDITQYIIGDGNPLNVSQFVSIKPQATIIDVNRAEEFLDTNIYELLPTGDARQARIVRLFQELNALLPPLPGTQGQPSFDENEDQRVDLDPDGNWISSSLYDQNTSISYAQNNQDSNIDEEDAFLHRLRDTSNDTNLNLTIQDIYNTVEPYLQDILEDPIELQDMPLYQNQSSGYLQFRNPNQGIIIRNTNQEFVQGLDPNNPTYLQTGFTITMWVKFLDKASEGTLFNFGNPTRDENPFGFKLETYVLNKNDGNFTSNNYSTYGEAADYINPSTGRGQGPRDPNYPLVYENSNTARFVRLIIEDNEVLRDSHTATGGNKKNVNIYRDERDDDNNSLKFRRLTTTFILEDFNEWYFICATFNPFVNEDGSDFNIGGGANATAYLYWLNHLDFNNNLTVNSFLGNRCKVEIISRSDLLRARGFRV